MAFSSLTTSTQIANLALQRVGEKVVTLITDNNERARNVNLIYQFELDDLTASYKWRFARRRTTISLATTAITSFADAGGGLVTVNSTAHGLLDKENANISSGSVGSYDGDHLITLVDANSYTITATFVSTETATSRWTSDQWEWRFALPTDLEKFVQVESGISEDYKVEGAFIVTNAADDNLILVYDRKISDVSLMPTFFIRLLYMRIGSEIMPRRKGDDPAFKDRFDRDLFEADREARRKDRQQDFEDDQGAFTILSTDPPSRTEANILLTPLS